VDLVARGLHFPTSLTFDDRGRIYVAESGIAFGGAPAGGRILRVEPDGRTVAIREDLRDPVNGLCFHDGFFYISEGGWPGRISRLSLDGEYRILVAPLPGLGLFQTNMAVVGPDRRLWFSQGALTNSGIVGLDSLEVPWLRRLPHNHDIPGFDVVLSGMNAETDNPASTGGRRVRTGPFSPFGVETKPGQRIAGRLPCTAAVMRCGLDGSGLELVAWGLRNAYGLLFLPDGRLLATEQGADDRGSRPIGHAPDLLFEVVEGAWYGWPDFVGGVPVTDPRFRPSRGAMPRRLLANHGELPPPEEPLLEFPPHAAATKLDVIPEGAPRWPEQILVALFGALFEDNRPLAGQRGPRAGRSLARIDPANWTLHAVKAGPFHRPIDVRVEPSGDSVVVVDFGAFEAASGVHEAKAGSGAVWRIPLRDL
jgi:hypothetical protein